MVATYVDVDLVLLVGVHLECGGAFEDGVCFVERAALLEVEVRVSPRGSRVSIL
jgi:hypothetical protein